MRDEVLVYLPRSLARQNIFGEMSLQWCLDDRGLKVSADLFESCRCRFLDWQCGRRRCRERGGACRLVSCAGVFFEVLHRPCSLTGNAICKEFSLPVESFVDEVDSMILTRGGDSVTASLLDELRASLVLAQI